MTPASNHKNVANAELEDREISGMRSVAQIWVFALPLRAHHLSHLAPASALPKSLF
jgi:hypothetical protein